MTPPRRVPHSCAGIGTRMGGGDLVPSTPPRNSLDRDIVLSPMYRALHYILCCFALTASSALAQVADSAQAIGVQAVQVLGPHLVLIPKTPVPKTGQPLPITGHWSVANQPPAQCASVPAGSGPCVRLVYSVPEDEVSCEWVVLLNTNATDLTFLDENDDAAHYFMPKLSTASLKPLIQSRSEATYPAIARAAHVSGDVKLSALVGADGNFSVTLLSGPPMIAPAAEDALAKWRFKPLMIGNRPSPYQAVITFQFAFPASGTASSIP